MTDSTNLTDDYTRNRIRHNIIPLLCEINPGLSSAVNRLCMQAEENESYFDYILDNLSDEEAVVSHPAVRRRYIIRKLHENGIEVNSLRVSDMDSLMASRSDTRYSLSTDIFAVFRKGMLSIEKREEFRPFRREITDIPCEIAVPECGKTVKIFCEEKDRTGNRGLQRYYLERIRWC